MNNLEDLIMELKTVLDAMLEAYLKGDTSGALRHWAQAERLLMGAIRGIIAGS